tara:strand:+ start:83387 stop:83995 length:609 start_codon:yes stop_codon:yes gene_type:complete
MAKIKYLLFGAGGHAKVVISIVTNFGGEILGIFDDNLNKKTHCGLPVLGKYEEKKYKSSKIIVCVGPNIKRKKIVSQISHDFFTAIDKSSIVDKNSKIGLGSVIAHNSVIQTDVKIGKHCIINTSSSVDHDCEIGDYVHVGPGVTICGNVEVGSCSLIGAGSVILPNIKIGKNVTVGAGSVVLNDIPNNLKVVGSPAKKMNQ